MARKLNTVSGPFYWKKTGGRLMSFSGHPDRRWGYISYAQHGDDLMLVNIFELLGIEKPSYLDLGAHHPTIISNTKLLYERGSRGVNVEANPALYPAFLRERPEDINLNVGVSTQEGKQVFHIYGPGSGRNTFSEREVESLKGVLNVTAHLELPTVRLETIVCKYLNDKWPDLLLCDIEGYDYDVLKSIPTWPLGTDVLPAVICVETRRHESNQMIEMLDGKDFFPYCRTGENLIFIKKSLRQKVY
jgi:FkbM family methyltransferase